MDFELSKTECVVDREVRALQMAYAMQRGLPVCTKEPAHTRKLAIVASGPSLKDYLDELREFDGDVWAINGALDYLNRSGVTVSGFVCIDPQDWLADYLKNPPSITYYIASVCHPDVFDAVNGHDVRIWHLKDADSPENAVPGGTVCVTRAPYLALMLGYRDISLFGCDGSFAETNHVYGDGYERPDARLTVQVGNEFFETEVGFFHQASELGAMQEIFADRYPGVSLKFRCGGLAAAYLSLPVMSLEDVSRIHGAHGG